jgi:hypothetical protein
MTWRWGVDPDTGALLCWDHTQDPSTDAPVATIEVPNGQSGWSWTGDYPDEILDSMHDEATAAVAAGDVRRAVAITLDMAGEQIERDDGDSSGGTL